MTSTRTYGYLALMILVIVAGVALVQGLSGSHEPDVEDVVAKKVLEVCGLEGDYQILHSEPYETETPRLDPDWFVSIRVDGKVASGAAYTGDAIVVEEIHCPR